MAEHPRKIRNDSGGRANKTVLRRILFLLAICGIALFVPLGIKLYSIQIINHDYYENLAVEQQTRETKVTAARGTIYDRNMNILAISASAETVFISPAEIKANDESIELIAQGLSQILGVDYDSVVQKAQDTKSYYKTIKTKIEQDLADQVRAFISENNLKGVKLAADTKRYYPYSSLAANVLGFVGTDNTGLEGLEALYNTTLSGKDGLIVAAKNANGSDMSYKYEQYIDSETGDSVELTIDTNIQYYLEKYLEEAISDYDVENGATGIVMDVNTGEILAMASLPNYNSNDPQTVTDTAAAEKIAAATDDTTRKSLLAEAQLKQWRNKALQDTYEPGSVFKIITLASALEEGVISTSDTFYDGGSIAVKGRTTPVKCWKAGGHGSQTLAQAVQNSCNVAFVQIGLRLGAENFYKYIKAFGFLDETDIDLPGEADSIFWDYSVFGSTENLSSLAAASFGQTFKITPIQLITAVSAVANGGYLMEPYIVKKVTDANGNVVKSNEPTVVRQVISEETSQICCELLESVVSSGTGKNAYVAGYRVAGKTGTSQKIDEDTGDMIVSFLGFAPADDPKVAVLVLLDTPSRTCGTYLSGGQMAAPIVGKVLAEILPYLGVEPEYTAEELLGVDTTVPSVIGMSLDQAASTLKKSGFSYRTVGTGDKVTAQTPVGGSIVPNSAEIVLYFGDEKPAESVKVPDLLGMTAEEANRALTNAGLYMKATGATASTSSHIRVEKQSVAAGTSVAPGTVIEVQFADISIYD